MRVWQTGEQVRITYEGRPVDGEVELASPNGRSLAVRFDAVLGGYVGMMPALWDEQSAAFVGFIHQQVRVANHNGRRDSATSQMAHFTVIDRFRTRKPRYSSRTTGLISFITSTILWFGHTFMIFALQLCPGVPFSPGRTARTW